MTVGLAENSKPAWLKNGLKPSWEKAFFFLLPARHLTTVLPRAGLFCAHPPQLLIPGRMSAFTGKR